MDIIHSLAHTKLTANILVFANNGTKRASGSHLKHCMNSLPAKNITIKENTIRTVARDSVYQLRIALTQEKINDSEIGNWDLTFMHTI